MKHRLKRRGENWKRALPRPIVLREGKPLRILSDCRNYVLNLAEGEQAHDKRQRAAELLFAVAAGGDMAAVVDQFERTLIHENKINLS
jgi:hypothetical protein